jgi:hypothetical protein
VGFVLVSVVRGWPDPSEDAGTTATRIAERQRLEQTTARRLAELREMSQVIIGDPLAPMLRTARSLLPPDDADFDEPVPAAAEDGLWAAGTDMHGHLLEPDEDDLLLLPARSDRGPGLRLRADRGRTLRQRGMGLRPARRR